jgi:hypothetical protein
MDDALQYSSNVSPLSCFFVFNSLGAPYLSVYGVCVDVRADGVAILCDSGFLVLYVVVPGIFCASVPMLGICDVGGSLLVRKCSSSVAMWAVKACRD